MALVLSTGPLVAIMVALMSLGDAVPVRNDVKESSMSVNVYDNGAYDIQVNGQIWLPSADTYFYADGRKYALSDGSLDLVDKFSVEGHSKFGDWNGTSFRYNAGKHKVVTTVKDCGGVGAAIFTQRYESSASGSSSGDINTLSSAFPSFKIQGTYDLGYLSYGGEFLIDHFRTGKWSESTAKITDGVMGGPLLLFDHSNNVLIITPLDQFMSASMYQNEATISWGIMGGVTEVPYAHESSFMVYFNNNGVNEAMRQWGALMRFYYDRGQSFRDTDLTINYLGFWTDNGAYYYHNPGQNRTYEADILAVKADSVKRNIPYRYVQYDDWWYYWGGNHGDVTWTPRQDTFPDGLLYLWNKTEWPVHAHNKYWSVNTTYAKQNGGKYDFIVDSTMAMPNDTTFWPEFLKNATEWGLIVYEQDYLDISFLGMNATLSSVSFAREWLMRMAEGAAQNGLTIQYCMPFARHLLQAFEIPVVTQIRVNHDYQPSQDHWKIGVSSIFADAIGLAPFKDNFWTKEVQPGNIYHANATFYKLNAAIATLSTGPVGPSDIVGDTDVGLLMRCCNADGLILKPSHPITAIDSNILQHAFNDGSGPDGEVWSTTSVVSGFTFGTILAPSQSSPYKLTPADAGFGAELPPTVIFKHTWPPVMGVANFSQDSPLIISGCSMDDPCLWHTAPIIQIGSKQMYLYGELKKWVPMSPKRVTNIEISDKIAITMVGAVNEETQFSFGTDFTSAETYNIFLGPSGRTVFTVPF